MANPFNTHIQQLLVKEQAVAGTMETLLAADGKPRLYFGGAGEYRGNKVQQDRARNSLSKFVSLGGTKAMAFALKFEANTPDDMTAAYELAALFKASGHTITAGRRIAIGAITSGPIPRNATVTGATSGATGRVVRRHANGETHLYYIPLTGTLQAENLSFTGGASAASSGAPSAWGWSIKPGNPGVIVSIELNENGYAWSARDAMAGLSLECQSAAHAMWTIPVVGAKNNMGTKAMVSGIVYDTENPPVLYNGGLQLGSFLPNFTKWSFDLGVTPFLRQSGNAAGNTGIAGAWFGQRDPKIKVTYEHVPTADFDVVGIFEAETTFAFQNVIGQVAGKQVWFFADEAQIAEPPALPEQDTIRMADLTLACTSLTDNNDYEIYLG